MGKDAAEFRAQFHTRLGQVARELAKGLYPDGLPRGTKFSELEAVTGAPGDEMARRLIEINVQEQADDWPEDELGECPVCGGAARKAPDEPRVLTSTRGDVAWKERVAHRPRCRRAFSLRIERWVSTGAASARACSRRSSMRASTVHPITRRLAIWPSCPTWTSNPSRSSGSSRGSVESGSISVMRRSRRTGIFP